MKNKVSIIIPFYKNLKYLSKSINSIKDQSYKNYEIILIYDDENKNDLNIIKKKYKNLKKLKIFTNRKNFGAAKSRNIGMAKSKGNYIAFLDADDYWKKNKLFEQIKFMKKNFIDFSFTSYKIINNKNQINHNVKKYYSYNELLQKCDIGLSTVVMKSKLTKIGIFPTLKTQEDYALWLKYSRKNVKMMGLDKYLGYWRNTPHSLSKNIIQKLRDSFKLYYQLEKKNLIESLFRVIILSKNKLKKLYNKHN